jgi:hypothetical protein
MAQVTLLQKQDGFLPQALLSREMRPSQPSHGRGGQDIQGALKSELPDNLLYSLFSEAVITVIIPMPLQWLLCRPRLL